MLERFFATQPDGAKMVKKLEEAQNATNGDPEKLKPDVAPFILAAWLSEHGFAFPSMTFGGDLSSWFSAGKSTSVKEMGENLKSVIEMAKAIVRNTIAQQELLQKQANRNKGGLIMNPELVKKQILSSLGLQIENLNAQIKKLNKKIMATTTDPRYNNIYSKMDPANVKGTAITKPKNPDLVNLSEFMGGVLGYYTKNKLPKDVDYLKQITTDFFNLVNKPDNIYAKISTTPAGSLGSMLKEEGRNALPLLSRMTQNAKKYWSSFMGGKVPNAAPANAPFDVLNPQGNPQLQAKAVQNAAQAAANAKPRGIFGSMKNRLKSAGSWFTQKLGFKTAEQKAAEHAAMAKAAGRPPDRATLQALVENPISLYNRNAKGLVLRSPGRPSAGDPTVVTRTRKNRSHRR
jgi:hypothetical protein